MRSFFQNILLIALLVASYIYYIVISDISVSAYTFLFSLLVFGLYKACKSNNTAKFILAYAILAVTPLLTLSGQIGTLTGFTRSEGGLPWLGVSFATLSIAYLVYKDKLNLKELFLNALQPLRFSSGPVANRTLRQVLPNLARVRIYFGWMVLGAFFYSVLAAGLAPLLFLKTSTHALDVLVFGIIFEIYVYLNFAGISFMVYGMLGLAGVPVTINFKTPFASSDIMGYWQRWHLSFGAVLKEMIFNPLRKHLGLGITVIVVFMMSAMWHGVTFNFAAWGLFHGLAWVMAYQLARLPWRRIGTLLNILLLPIIVILGRIIFAESDESMLTAKLTNLLFFRWSNEAYVVNLILDTKTAVCVVAASLYVASEVLRFKISYRYKYWRKNSSIVILLILIVLFGSTGLEGVYGTR